MEDIDQLKKDLHAVTVELIGGCPYCTLISTNHEFKTPIYCSRFTGPVHPTCLDVRTCLACGEYKNARAAEVRIG